MRVADVMSRAVVSVSPRAPIKEVARLLLERRISGLPVVNDEGRVLGVVSEGDVLIKEKGVAPAQGHALRWLFGEDDRESLKRGALTAAEAMSCPAITVEPERSVSEAARLMVARSVNRLPVVTDGRLVGIVTRADLVRAFVRTDEELEREIRNDVLLDTLWIDPATVQLTVEAGEVILQGKLATRTDAELAAAYVARVPGVVSVDGSDLTWNQDDLARRRYVDRPQRRLA